MLSPFKPRTDPSSPSSLLGSPGAFGDDGASLAESAEDMGTVGNESAFSVSSRLSSVTGGTLIPAPGTDPHELARHQRDKQGDNNKTYLHNTLAPHYLTPDALRNIGAGNRGIWVCIDCKTHNHSYNASCEFCRNQKHFEPGEDVVTPFGVGVVQSRDDDTGLYTIILSWQLGQQHTLTMNQKINMGIKTHKKGSVQAMKQEKKDKEAIVSSNNSVGSGSTVASRRKAAKAFLNQSSLRYPEDIDMDAMPSTARFFKVNGIFESLENFADWLPRVLRDETSGLDNLELGYQGLTDLGAIALGSALEVNSTLVTVNLSGNGIGEDGARALGQGLSNNTALRLLILDNNPMGNTQYDVRRNDDVKRLKFLMGSLTKSFPDYGDPLPRVPQPLVRLHPERPRKPPKRADKNYSKYDIVYSHGRFDVGDMVEVKYPSEDPRFEKSLWRAAVIERVHLSRGVCALFEGLATNCVLEEVRMSNCGIQDEGAHYMIPFIEKNIALRTLIMTTNNIGRATARTLKQALVVGNNEAGRVLFEVEV